MTKAADATTVTVGQTVTYRITVHNTGPNESRSTPPPEIDLAHQLLTSLNRHATTINVCRAELIRDAGGDMIDDQIATLRSDIAGLASLIPAIELACAFHQAVLDDHTALHATITRLRDQTSDDDQAYFVDIAQFMADMPVGGS
ncbi:hypothetical protein AB0M58_24710 [Streptomyces bobili]|uniref:hypothetical protein n=1 Tax=Streptomyces bobili TaxID=67280 RepID=UPI0034120EAE